MSAIFQTWNRIFVKNLIHPNHRICARYYSSLIKCHHHDHHKNCVLLNQIAKEPNFSIQPYDKREFIGWVRDKKDGYRTQKDESETAHAKFGIKKLKTELKIWKEEVKERFRYDPMMFVPPGEIDTVFEFGKQEDIDKFVVTADSDHNEGYSHCTFKLNQSGYGLFSGVLDSAVPKQGQISKAGYCNITSLRVMKSFQRESYFDWHAYNTLVLRVRGDGRPYSIQLHSDGFFDVTWHDIYTYVLYTRGGPHWQLTKIPFSKFYLTAKGCIQDKHHVMESTRVARIGITAAGLDWMDGEFNLEIDYIGVENNPYHTEQTAYELYKAPNFVMGT